MLSSLRWDSNPGQTQANILPLYQLNYGRIYKRLQRELNSYLYCDRVASYPLDHAAKKLNSYFSSLRLPPQILLCVILQLRQLTISTCSHVSISFYTSYYNLQQSYSLTLFELGCIINSIAIKLMGNIALNSFLYFELCLARADEGTRTLNLLITGQLRYQLRHTSIFKLAG